MVKQTLKYGLTTALRSFDVPDVWNGHEEIMIEGATVLSDVQHEDTRVLSISTRPESTAPVTITRDLTGDCKTLIEVLITKGSHVTITEFLKGHGSAISSVKLNVMSDADVTYTIIQELGESSLALLRYEAEVHHAQLKWLFVGLGADTTQAYVHTDAGERADIVNNAVLYGTGSQQFDIHVSTNHLGSRSKSDMLTRSVLDGKARAIYHGLIHIGQDAPECDSYQKDEVILLSDRAGADAIPNLEIQNNTVRCTHGASIGKLDEEKLFYLRSRGISEEEAKRMITEGFLFSMLPQTLHARITQKAGGDDA